MEQIKNIDEILKKYKKNSKISILDKDNLKKELINILQNENMWETAIYYVINSPEETGIEVYFDYYKTLMPEKRKLFINAFVSNDQFSNNSSSNKGISRGIALISKLIKENLDDAAFVIQHVSSIIAYNKKKKIAEQILVWIQIKLLLNNSEDLFRIRLEKFNDKEYFESESLFINAAFYKTNKCEVPALIQFGVLNWIFKSGRKIKIIGEEKNLIEQVLRTWPDDVKDKFKSQNELLNAYKDSFDLIDILKNNGLPCILDNNKASEISNENLNNSTKKTKSEDLEKNKKAVIDDLKWIIQFVDNQDSSIKQKDIEINKLKEEVNILKIELQDEHEKNEKLVMKSRNYQQEIENKNVESFANKELIKNLNISISECENKLHNLLNIDSMEDSSSLKEYKNKLSGKLRNNYREFLDIKNEEMTVKLGEVVRDLMNQVFALLVNNDITF